MDARKPNIRQVFETQFNDILISDSKSKFSTQLCANRTVDKDYDMPKFNASDAPDYPQILRFSLVIFRACRVVRVRNCVHPTCIATMDDLKLVMPLCPTWAGLEQWALQTGACLCSGKSGILHRGIFHEIISIRDRYPEFQSAPNDMSYVTKPAAFADWARQVNPFEVITLLSWVYGLSFGRHRNLSPLMPGLAQLDEYRDRAISQAISRAHKLYLCPHRVWAIAFSMPGQESNIPALVPYKHSPCSYRHDYCSSGLSHKNCTYDHCHISAVNFTNVVPCHRPNCDGKCQKKVFPIHLLDKVANENKPTAWAIDGELRPLEAREPYMAISHVWSDGTGGSGSVNECMYNFFCDVARKLKCKGLWWDAICIPQDKHARAKAINHMHEYYFQAAYTVVHDACLAMSEWIDGEHASFALVMSNWFTRGWTALELSRSKHVKVLFSAGQHTGYVLKNLDVDILSGPAIVSSMTRHAVSRAIYSLRKNLQSEVRYNLNDVLIALGSRFTSWVRDRAIIAGQFVGLETLADDQYSIYQQVVCKIGQLSSHHLFHHLASPTGPFAWLPSSLFDLPVALENAPKIEVLKDGSLLGTWDIILFPVDLQVYWDAMHPMSRYHVREALNDNRHIILIDHSAMSITRGLLVKVMKDTDKSYDILCHYVGPIYFAPLPCSLPDATDFQHYSYTILINDSGADLDAGVSAVDHIRSLVPHKNGIFEFREGKLFKFDHSR